MAILSNILMFENNFHGSLLTRHEKWSPIELPTKPSGRLCDLRCLDRSGLAHIPMKHGYEVSKF